MILAGDRAVDWRTAGETLGQVAGVSAATPPRAAQSRTDGSHVAALVRAAWTLGGPWFHWCAEHGTTHVVSRLQPPPVRAPHDAWPPPAPFPDLRQLLLRGTIFRVVAESLPGHDTAERSRTLAQLFTPRGCKLLSRGNPEIIIEHMILAKVDTSDWATCLWK